MNASRSKATALRLAIAVDTIAARIQFVRGQKVILDSDLAMLYGVQTRRLNEQVRRNIDRFPADFMFELSRREFGDLMSQFATSSDSHGGRRKLPLVFTEHGALMAASVLNSPRARDVSIYVVRAFVQLRDLLTTNKALAAKFEELARKVESHDQAIAGLIETIRELMAPPPAPKRRPIGFVDLEDRSTK